MLQRALLLALSTVAAFAEAAPPAPAAASDFGMWVQVRRAASRDLPAPDGEIVVTGSRLRRYIGRYAINGTIATVRLTSDRTLTVTLTGQREGTPLRAVGANEFVSDDVGVRLFFEGDGPKTNRIRSRYLGNEVFGTRLDDGEASDGWAAT